MKKLIAYGKFLHPVISPDELLIAAEGILEFISHLEQEGSSPRRSNIAVEMEIENPSKVHRLESFFLRNKITRPVTSAMKDIVCSFGVHPQRVINITYPSLSDPPEDRTQSSVWKAIDWYTKMSTKSQARPSLREPRNSKYSLTKWTKKQGNVSI
jgi:hypothetical protein